MFIRALSKIRLFAVVGVLALTAFGFAANAHEDHGDAAGDGHAPAFTAMNAAGETVNLSDFAGKTVVLEWINYGCPYVQKHYGSGNMQALQEKYTAAGVVWLSINSSAEGKQGYFTGEDLAKQNADHNNKATHYLLDTDGTIGKAYGATATPHMFVIDGEGHIVYQGAIDSISTADKADIEKAENYVTAALDGVAAGTEIATPSTQAYGCGIKYAD